MSDSHEEDGPPDSEPDTAPPSTRDEGHVPLTEERRRLVESVTGYAEALAILLAEDMGMSWLPDLRSAAWLGATLAARHYDFGSKARFATFAWSAIFGAMIDMLRKERARLRPETAAMLERAAAVIGAGLDYAAHVHDRGGDELQEEADGAAAALGIAALCMGAPEPDPEALLLREERRALVRRAISYLAERDRAIVHMRHFEQRKMKEIADHFGVHEDTAGTWHKAALKRLGALLRPIFREP